MRARTFAGPLLAIAFTWGGCGGAAQDESAVSSADVSQSQHEIAVADAQDDSVTAPAADDNAIRRNPGVRRVGRPRFGGRVPRRIGRPGIPRRVFPRRGIPRVGVGRPGFPRRLPPIGRRRFFRGRFTRGHLLPGFVVSPGFLCEQLNGQPDDCLANDCLLDNIDNACITPGVL
jgi:hypothetical protein